MSSSKRDEALNAITSRLFDAMLSDIVMDIALQSHTEVARSREVCEHCRTRCGTVHVPPSAARANGTGSRAHTPLPSPAKTAGGAGTPNGKDTKGDTSGNVMLECMVCKRSVASNRFAQHLSGCLGLAGGARRGNARNAMSKAKLGSDGRSASPYVGSEAGFSEDESSPAKPKAKSKPKKAANGTKRALSPDRNSSPSPKKLKKAHQKLPPGSANGIGTNGISHLTANAQVKIPSKLQQEAPPPIIHAYSQSRTTDSSPDSASSGSPPPSPKPVVKKPPAPTPSKTVPSQQQQQQWTLPSSTSLIVNRRQPQPAKSSSVADLTGDYDSTSSQSD